MDFAYQGKNPPTKLVAMANASNLNITQGIGDTWLTDFGASITSQQISTISTNQHLSKGLNKFLLEMVKTCQSKI